MNSKVNSQDDRVCRWLCHIISAAITAVIAVFAAEGATITWPNHSKVARILAVLCAMAAGIGHLRFCGQFGAKTRTQSRLLLAFLIAVFATVSITLGAIAEYRDFGSPSFQSQPLEIPRAIGPTYRTGVNSVGGSRENSEGAVIVVSFFSNLLRGSAEALVPFCVGCFLEALPLAVLFLTVQTSGTRTVGRVKSEYPGKPRRASSVSGKDKSGEGSSEVIEGLHSSLAGSHPCMAVEASDRSGSAVK